MPLRKVPSKIQLNLDIKQIIIILLLVLVAVMLAIWKPWNMTTGSDRTIKVTGEATIKAEPDEYVFYPNYQFKNADKDAALAELTKKSDEIVAKLKELGVAPSKIKTNASGNNAIYFRDSDNTTTYSLSLTITTSGTLSQKVQDYLTTTSPLGGVSPTATFSQTLRKQLESRARDQATQDARAKADQSAHNLGFKISKVKSVEDGAGFGDVMPLSARSTMAIDGSTASAPEITKLGIQAGENEITYSVTVTYFVR
jgi:uncharacterized protein YggE